MFLIIMYFSLCDETADFVLLPAVLDMNVCKHIHGLSSSSAKPMAYLARKRSIN